MNNAYIRAQQCKVKEAKFPFVKIGEQYWTTKNLSLSVTPQGNTIPEVQANGNVEKVVNGDFGSDLSNWNVGTSATWDNGKMKIDSKGYYIYISGFTIGRLYKCTYTISDYVSGGVAIKTGDDLIRRTGNGTYTEYHRLLSVNGFIAFNDSVGGKLSIDNVSIQEIGWSGSQELYDGIYAQTSGTVEQKTYAAVKAAAMWCNYNNDAPTGVIYGKLYNWFAVKLLQMDIDYYNTANPNKKWANGFRMPTQAEFQTLSTFLGGDAVSGGHLKEAGLAHWNSPNTGADNSSGFSGLGSGRRDNNGGFNSLYSGLSGISITKFYCLNNLTSLSSANTALSFYFDGNTWGYSIRLIKA